MRYNGSVRAFVAAAMGMALMACNRTARQNDCGFSIFKPVEVAPESIADENTWWDRRTHWAVTPFYPPEARARGLSGTVHLRVLVDIDGRLVKMCPAYNPGEVAPNQILVGAAMTMVRKARFRSNFGLGAAGRPSFRYAQSTLDINFVRNSDSTK